MAINVPSSEETLSKLKLKLVLLLGRLFELLSTTLVQQPAARAFTSLLDSTCSFDPKKICDPRGFERQCLPASCAQKSFSPNFLLRLGSARSEEGAGPRKFADLRGWELVAHFLCRLQDLDPP